MIIVYCCVKHIFIYLFICTCIHSRMSAVFQQYISPMSSWTLSGGTLQPLVNPLYIRLYDYGNIVLCCEIFINSINFGISFWPFIRRMSAVYQPYIYHMTAICQPYIRHMSAICQLETAYVSHMSAVCQPYIRRMSAICLP